MILALYQTVYHPVSCHCILKYQSDSGNSPIHTGLAVYFRKSVTSIVSKGQVWWSLRAEPQNEFSDSMEEEEARHFKFSH